jgi:hypothetical protein
MGRIHTPYFTARELAAAKRAAEKAEKLAQQHKPAATSASLSQK